MFANNRFPISIEPTELPDGVVSDVHFDPALPPEMREDGMNEEVNIYGFKGDGKELPTGATRNTLKEMLGPLEDKFEGIDNLQAGVGKTPTAVTFSPALVAAKKMQKKVQDQLEESSASKHLRSTAFEMALFTILCLKQFHRYLTYLFGTFILIQMQTIWMRHSMRLNVIKCLAHKCEH